MRWLVVFLMVGCSRAPVTEQVGPEPLPVPFVPSATVVAPSVSPPVVVDADVPEVSDAETKWLETLAHPAIPWGHSRAHDVAWTLTRTFIDRSATSSDPASVLFAHEVWADSLVTGAMGPACAMEWNDVHVRASSPKARAAAHAVLVKAARGAKPTPWSNPFYWGERARIKRSGTVPWDDSVLLGVLYRGDEIVFLRGFQTQAGDADCWSLDDAWATTLKR